LFFISREVIVYSNILIATDGSELASKAVKHGVALAKSVGAKITAVTVETPFNVFSVPTSKSNQMSEAFKQYGQHIKEHASRILDGVASAAKAEGVACDAVQVEDDEPYRAIIAAAKNAKCDVIVMASHGRSGVSAMLLGSVTNKVLTHTDIPVIVCH
jgi:nucleotide-binding universal stress UspA family protein